MPSSAFGNFAILFVPCFSDIFSAQLNNLVDLVDDSGSKNDNIKIKRDTSLHQ